MKDYKIKSYSYKCKCGYTLNVFVDYGVPQESAKCRRCSCEIKREDTN